MEMAQPHERIWFDPNRAWLVDDAIRVISAVKDLAPMIENPCESYEECRNVARRTGVPFMLDEVIDGPRRFLEAVHDEVMDVASLKMSAIGGLEQTRAIMGLGAANSVSRCGSRITTALVSCWLPSLIWGTRYHAVLCLGFMISSAMSCR